MKLSTLLKNIIHPLPLQDIEVTGLALDSRKIFPGDLFFACKGTHLDGNIFIDDAIQKGTVAVLAEGAEKIEIRNQVPIIFVTNLSQKIGVIAARFYEYPTQKMHIVGATGTNGKTSCTHFIASALSQFSLPCGIIGTLGNGLYGNIQESYLTTPDAITLQQYFVAFLNENAKHVAMEVSSHSIDQGRINGIDFELGIFTNLTRDHLDYHGTMENYAATKRKFFENSQTKTLIINADDAFGQQLITDFHDKKPIFAYMQTPQSLPGNVSCIQASDVRQDMSGIHAHVKTPWGEGMLSVKLIAKFNLSNVLAALTALCLLKIPFEKALSLASQFQSVPGRMQTIGHQNKPLVIVDYAHTPDALEKVLSALRHHTSGKLICIFGCGGDRDRGKRPMMAAIAEKFSDQVMVTDDNPRTENPEQIFADIFQGFLNPDRILKEHNRAKAIQMVLQYAKTGDSVLIAGKGAESYQIIGEQKFPFSDTRVVETFFEV